MENVADFAHFVTVHGPGYFAGGDLWRNRRLLGWLVHQSYKLQWKEHKEDGQEHRCTLALQQNVLMMKWCMRLIPQYNVVVSMVNMFAMHTCFLALVNSRVTSTMLGGKCPKTIFSPLSRVKQYHIITSDYINNMHTKLGLKTK